MATLESLENHRHRSFCAAGDYQVIPQVIMENDLKIHVFLVAVESAVAVTLASTVASRFKDLDLLKF